MIWEMPSSELLAMFAPLNLMDAIIDRSDGRLQVKLRAPNVLYLFLAHLSSLGVARPTALCGFPGIFRPVRALDSQPSLPRHAAQGRRLPNRGHHRRYPRFA